MACYSDETLFGHKHKKLLILSINLVFGTINNIYFATEFYHFRHLLAG